MTKKMKGKSGATKWQRTCLLFSYPTHFDTDHQRARWGGQMHGQAKLQHHSHRNVL